MVHFRIICLPLFWSSCSCQVEEEHQCCTVVELRMNFTINFTVTLDLLLCRYKEGLLWKLSNVIVSIIIECKNYFDVDSVVNNLAMLIFRCDYHQFYSHLIPVGLRSIQILIYYQLTPYATLRDPYSISNVLKFVSLMNRLN